VRAIADQLGLEASVSPSRRGGSFGQLVEETGAVALGRIIGFDRLVNIDDRVDDLNRRAAPNLDPAARAARRAGRPAPRRTSRSPTCVPRRGLDMVTAPPSGGVSSATRLVLARLLVV